MRSLPTSPDSARRLLSGRRIGFELLTVGSGEAALEQMIQARLAAVGFEVTIRQLELSAFLDGVNARRHEFDAAVLGTPGDPGRLDLAGGWTDVPPFSAREGGLVVNAAIELHAHAELKIGGPLFRLVSEDLGQELECADSSGLVIDGRLDLLKAALRMFPVQA